jgi:hypothetical protein
MKLSLLQTAFIGLGLVFLIPALTANIWPPTAVTKPFSYAASPSGSPIRSVVSFEVMRIHKLYVIREDGTAQRCQLIQEEWDCKTLPSIPSP